MLPDTLRDLLPQDLAGPEDDVTGDTPGAGLGEALSWVLKADDAANPQGFGDAPRWQQLALVALTDAGLLSEERREEIQASPPGSPGGREVPEDVAAAYELAKYKLNNHG